MDRPPLLGLSSCERVRDVCRRHRGSLGGGERRQRHRWPSTAVIAVPNGVTLRDAPAFLESATWDIERDTTAGISFEPGHARIEPWVLAAIAAYALKATRWDMTVSVTGLADSSEATRLGLVRFIEPH